MSETHPSRTLSVRIDRDAAEVYDLLSHPENFAKWATGLGTLTGRAGRIWTAETPQGPARIRFTERNGFGVIDHSVTPPSGPKIHIPMRVIANGRGAEVLLTLLRMPGVSEDAFSADAAWVERDLNALQELLEQGGDSVP